MQKTWAKLILNSTYQPTVSSHVMFFDPLIPTQIQALADVHSIIINPDIRTLEDVESWVTVEDFHIYLTKELNYVCEYQHVCD